MRKPALLAFLIVTALCSHATDALCQTNTPNVRVWRTGSFPGPTNVPPDLTNAVAVFAGYIETCYAIRTDGRVVAWSISGWPEGLNPSLSNVVMMNGARNQFLTSDGSVRNWDGSLSAPYLTNIISMDNNPVFISDETGLFVRANGTLLSTLNVPLPNLTNVVAVAANESFRFALTSAGQVIAWTRYWNGLTNSFGSPELIATNAKAVSAYGYGADPNYGALIIYNDGTVNIAGFTNDIAAAVGGRNGYAILRNNGQVIGSNLSVPPDLPFVYDLSVGGSFCAAVVQEGVAVTPPVILGRPSPANQTALVGNAFTLKVNAHGVAPLTYQWYRNSILLEGATNSVLQISNAQTSHSGGYTVTVSNAAGVTASQAANVNITTSLGIVFVPRITLTADAGTTYRLEYLSSLGNTNDWRLVNTVTITNNPQYFYDDSAIGQVSRFYRLISTNSP